MVKPDKTVAVRNVTATVEGDRAAVIAGLAPGDHVVVEGQLSLAKGMQVVETVRGAGQAAAGASPRERP